MRLLADDAPTIDEPAKLPPQQPRLEAEGERGAARWEELDRKSLKYPDDLTDLLDAFVTAHPEEFGKVEADS